MAHVLTASWTSAKVVCRQQHFNMDSSIVPSRDCQILWNFSSYAFTLHDETVSVARCKMDLRCLVFYYIFFFIACLVFISQFSETERNGCTQRNYFKMDIYLYFICQHPFLCIDILLSHVNTLKACESLMTSKNVFRNT